MTARSRGGKQRMPKRDGERLSRIEVQWAATASQVCTAGGD
jgi:hypothetical protein